MIGLTTSFIGSHIFLIALSWVAVQTTTPANVGWILLANAVPEALILLFGGVLVDRVGPKRIIVVSDSLRTLIMIILLVVIGSGSLSPLLLAVLAALFGIVDGFFQPAVASVPRFLGPTVSVTRLSAAKTVASRVSAFISSPAASALLLLAGSAWVFGVNAGLFAISVVALLLTRMVPPSRHTVGSAHGVDEGAEGSRSMWADMASGFRAIRSNKALARLLLIIFLLELGFVGQTAAGVPLLAKEAGWGVGAIGWIIGGFGLGSATVAGLLSWRKGVSRGGLVMCLGLVIMAGGLMGLAALALIGASGSVLVLSGGIGVLMGIGAGLFGTLANAAMLEMAPAAHVGRVVAALAFTSRTAIPFSYALTGLLTSWSSAKVPFVFGALVILAAAIIAAMTRAVRRFSSRPEVESEDVGAVTP
ncbi:MFS transporter [Microlunatus sp. GCM10028923]|uniref:MFS transporter n=1 Tax=Microlunatus sp. GCM10028923 TaxID=3273400 RepID=UPI00361F3B98